MRGGDPAFAGVPWRDSARPTCACSHQPRHAYTPSCSSFPQEACCASRLMWTHQHRPASVILVALGTHADLHNSAFGDAPKQAAGHLANPAMQGMPLPGQPTSAVAQHRTVRCKEGLFRLPGQAGSAPARGRRAAAGVVAPARRRARLIWRPPRPGGPGPGGAGSC